MCSRAFEQFYSYDPGKAAELFGQVASLLAGFSLAALVLMLQRHDEIDTTISPDRFDSIQRSLFAALMTLMLAALLFANAAGATPGGQATARSMTLVSLAGIVFACGVFTVLHGVIQMLLLSATNAVRTLTRICSWAAPTVGIVYVDLLLWDLIERITCRRIAFPSVDILALAGPTIVLLVALYVQHRHWHEESRPDRSGSAFKWATRIVVAAAVISGLVSKFDPDIDYWTWPFVIVTSAVCYLLFIFASELERVSV